MSTKEIIGKYGGENCKRSHKSTTHNWRLHHAYTDQDQKKNEIKAASGQVTIPSIKLTCEMNDIMLINLVHKSTSRVNAAVQYKQYRTMDTLTSLTTPSVIEFPDWNR